MKKQSAKLFFLLILVSFPTALFGAPHTASQSAAACAAAVNTILVEIEKIRASLTCSTGSCPSIALSQKDFDANGGVYVIEKPGTYTLSEDIQSIASSSDGILIVKSSFVKLNFCGHRLLGNGTIPGVFIPDNTRFITITNGAIENTTYGIRMLNDSGALTCSLLNFIKNSEFGISLHVSGQCFIRGCTFTTCGAGGAVGAPRGAIELVSMRNTVIDGCVMRDFDDGESVAAVVIEDSVQTTITRCIIEQMSPKVEARGILVNKSSRLVVNQAVFYKLITDDQITGIVRGIDIAESSGIVCRDITISNVISGNVQGIFLAKSSDGLIENCNLLGAIGQGTGFELFPAERIIFRNCFVQAYNAPSPAIGCAGFSCESGKNNALIGCVTATLGADDTAIGIRLAGEIASLVEACTIRSTISTNHRADGILLGRDRNTGADCTGCVVERCSVSYTEGPRPTSYRDTSGKSQNYFSENRAFKAGVNYDVNYGGGPLPTASGSLSTGFPALGSTGAFDNLDMQP